MNRVSSFHPIADRSSRILVLGSMPGEASLKAGQYYAHPRNLFWQITASILGFDARAQYERRLSALQCAHVALWDVFHSCVRIGSLDTAIEVKTETLNDFPAFFAEHPNITLVCFN